MIPTELQDVLVKEMGSLFSGMQLKNPDGEYVAVNIYPQCLPVPKKDEHENTISPFPYVVVRIQEGEGVDEESGDTCKLMFVVGTFDDDESNQGHKDVLNVLEKIRQHLFKKRIFNKQFECVYPYKWTVNEEDVCPYYFGGMETNWTVPKLLFDDEEGLT
ncbi:hypothetical protein [Desulfosporosinus sp. FKB]|uniref:hypothetical protein n=1 Tax=Desulfosporosinus sp. FKB TaxID=1969835 RepID=UPI000B4A072B|nr:hypothetical protein [Desulfosporosinus sp. FKB]